MRIGVVSILFLFGWQLAVAQQDSLRFNAIVEAKANHQSGNLNQFGGLVLLNLTLADSTWYGRLAGNYTFAKIEGFTVLNDFWVFTHLKYQHSKRFYPTAMVYSGFAKSFGIESAQLMGVGGGLNIWQKSQSQFLNLNVISGYATFDYRTNATINGWVTNAFISGNTSLFKKKLDLNWELHTYFLPKDEVHGVQNNLRIGVPITKQLMVSATQQIIYNNHVEPEIERVNTLLFLGLSVKI